MPEEQLGNPMVLRGKFYLGHIVKVRPGHRAGVVQAAASGRRIPFEWPLVRLIGAERIEELRPGMEVGFDVSWTSKGLRVSVIKVFRDGETQELSSEEQLDWNDSDSSSDEDLFRDPI